MRSACIAIAAALAALVATPAGAISSNLVRTFVPTQTIDFDALPLGPLAAGAVVGTGVTFEGAYPPWATGPAGAIVSITGGRALDLASGQAAVFRFDPPVQDVGATVRKLDGSDSQVAAYALDDANVSLYAFGYIYIPPTTVRYPEFVDAIAVPITTFILIAQGGSYEVDDLVSSAPEPGTTAASAAAILALALRTRRRQEQARVTPRLRGRPVIQSGA